MTCTASYICNTFMITLDLPGWQLVWPFVLDSMVQHWLAANILYCCGPAQRTILTVSYDYSGLHSTNIGSSNNGGQQSSLMGANTAFPPRLAEWGCGIRGGECYRDMYCGERCMDWPKYQGLKCYKPGSEKRTPCVPKCWCRQRKWHHSAMQR